VLEKRKKEKRRGLSSLIKFQRALIKNFWNGNKKKIEKIPKKKKQKNRATTIEPEDE